MLLVPQTVLSTCKMSGVQLEAETANSATAPKSIIGFFVYVVPLFSGL